MDPFSIAAGAIALMETSGALLSFCYRLRQGLRKVPWQLIRIIEEIRDLRNITEAIQSAIDNEASGSRCENLCRSIQGPLAATTDELLVLEKKLRFMSVDGIMESKRKIVAHAIIWQVKDREIRECIARLERCKSSLNLSITSQNSVSLRNMERATISFTSRLEESCSRLETLADLITTSQLGYRERDIIQWISPSTPWDCHNAAIKLHQPGTSNWLSESAEYEQWLSKNSRIFWLSGPLGAGKTLLFAHTVETFAGQLDNYKGAICAFTYCDFRSPSSQGATMLLGSLLNQVCTKLGAFPDALLEAYENQHQRYQTSRPTADVLVQSLVRISRRHRLFLFIDALDESGDVQELVDALVWLTSAPGSDVKIFVTSRNDVQVQTEILQSVLRIDLVDRIGEMDRDIHHYIRGRMESDFKLRWLSPEIRNHILNTMSSRSLGMFRWAQCQMDTILRSRTIKDINRALETLPRGLDETYDRVLSEIGPNDVELFRKALRWLAFSFFPLTLEELWEAIAIEPGSRYIDDECRLCSPHELVSLGHSLISVTSSGHVRLAHYSVRKYLLSDKIRTHPTLSKFALEFTEEHGQLLRDCLTYLSFDEFHTGPQQSKDGFDDRTRRLPLARYASIAWTYHYRAYLSGTGNSRNTPALDTELQELAFRFFSSASHSQFMSWVQTINADCNLKWNVYPRHATPLYYASSFGLADVVRHLLLSNPFQNLDAPGSLPGGTALHAAAIRHHIPIMILLLDAGADPGQADFNGVTPLHSIASQGNMEVVEVLLRYGAPLDARDFMDGTTPAEWARMSGQDHMVRFLEETWRARSAWNRRDGSKVLELCFGKDGGGVNALSSREVVVWKPGDDYFPSDFCNKRSGLTSSILVSVEVDGEVTPVEEEFSPVVLLAVGS
ncbi:hypothetical protein B0T17DRAFT_245852 [Bombardia bombarda]|uniref:NACHT domain-containing protein n=1 Tax=Bombardia bombarda TaxID=252184 RepID=A0AA39X083_9PEZI|nr:hypothetical protein B0T17DRAFT_245852 [Bombardia bombarda]